MTAPVSESSDFSLEKTLRLSVDKLYVGGEDLLQEIESGLNTVRLAHPRVGYQGVAGSFGEQATVEYFRDAPVSISHYREFEEVLRALNAGEIDYGVLPIENSFAGDVLEVSDLIIRYNLYIVGEHILRVRHNLLGLPGANIAEIQNVYSHPQALSQCREFLHAHPDMVEVPYANTALAGQYVARERDARKASIGSLRCAELYGLAVLAENIQTAQNNYTRFIVLSRRMEISRSCDKVSVVFSTMHTSGALYGVLSHFAYNGLNLLKIQSRPKRESPWEYVFFLDIAGNLEDANVLIALGRVREQSSYFKLLGNYVQFRME